MMFRRSAGGQQDDPDLLEARRRLQASMFGGGDNNGGPDAQQLQLYREQQMLLDARAAALGAGGAGAGAGGHQSNAQSNMNPQHFNSFSSSFPQQQQQQQASNMGGQSGMGGQSSAMSSMGMGMNQQQQQMLQQQLQQQQQQQSSGAGQFGPSSHQGMDDSFGRHGLGGGASSSSNMLPDQRLALQRAQLEVQRHAQAQAQAEARVKALLGQEAQVQDQMRLLRQRQQQLQSPSSQTTLSQSAYDMLSSPAGRNINANLNTGGGHQLDNARLGNRNMASSLMGGSASRQQQTNSVLPPGLGGDDFGGKISRQSSEHVVADVQAQRQLGILDNDPNSKNKLDGGHGEKGPGAEDSDDDEEEQLDDDEYFKAQAGEPNADGGYPVAREAFPMKLYRILYEAEKNKQDDIISFFPHGRAFAVHKSKEFTRDIMPKYFPAGRMNTFLKQLNLYGFRRITEGRDKGGYFHKDFLKGKRHLCKKIKRKKVHVTKAQPSAPAVNQHFQLQQSQLPFLDHSLGGALGNHGLNATPTNQQLLQQQQMALGLSGTSANGGLFPGSAGGNNMNVNGLFNNPSELGLSQAYVQDHFSSGGASRLGQSNLNLNFGNSSNNNGMMNGMNMNMNMNHPNLR